MPDLAALPPLQSAWNRAARLPCGRALFSRMLARRIPYTGTIRPRIEEIREGYARARMSDRRGVRNHLRSVHAIALVNLAEVVTGLAMFSKLASDQRGIVTGLSIEYLKKARGTLTADCTVELRPDPGQRQYEVRSFVRDAAGEEVARATVHWLIGPKP